MKMKFLLSVAFLPAFALVGCGGGGGGGSGVSSTLAPLSRPVITYTGGALDQANTVYTADSIQRGFNYTYSGDNVSDVTFTGESSGRIDLGLDANTTLDYVRIISTSQGTDFSLSRGAGDSFIEERIGSVSLFEASSTSGSQRVLLSTEDDFNYQSFGWWLNDTSVTSGVGASFSVGAPTDPANIPTSGSAVYSGFSTGFYIVPDGTPYVTASTISATANFGGTPTLSINSSETQGVNMVSGGNSIALTDANFTGSLEINRATGKFVGSVNGTLSGTASGAFFGPAYEEIGGTFQLQGGGRSYVGSFGARR